MSRLPIQRLRTANDFENFVGNRCLARFVVGELELVSELGGVVCGLVHGRHSCAVFTRKRVAECFKQLGFECLWNQGADDLFLSGFIEII